MPDLPKVRLRRSSEIWRSRDFLGNRDFFILLTLLFGFSDAHIGYLGHPSKGDYFGPPQDSSHHNLFHRSENSGQIQHQSPVERSSNPDLYQKYAHYDQFEQPNHDQSHNYRSHDQHLHPHGGLDRLGNQHQHPPHSFSGEYQHSNYPYLPNDGVPESGLINYAAPPQISSHPQQQEHLGHPQKHHLSLQEKSDYSSLQQQSNVPGSFRHFNQPNEHERIEYPIHQQQLRDSPHLWRPNQSNRYIQSEQPKEHEVRSYPSEDQQFRHHDSGNFAAGFEHPLEPVKPSYFSSHDQYHEYADPLKFSHQSNLNGKSSNLDYVQLLRDLDLLRQLKERNEFQHSQHFSDLHRGDYHRENPQLNYRDNEVINNGSGNNSNPLVMRNSEGARRSLQQREYSDEFVKPEHPHLNENTGYSDQFPQLRNSGYFPVLNQPNHQEHLINLDLVRHFHPQNQFEQPQHLSAPQQDINHGDDQHLNFRGARGFAVGLENNASDPKLSQISKNHQKKEGGISDQADKFNNSSLNIKVGKLDYLQELRNSVSSSNNGTFNRPSLAEELQNSNHFRSRINSTEHQQLNDSTSLKGTEPPNQSNHSEKLWNSSQLDNTTEHQQLNNSDLLASNPGNTTTPSGSRQQDNLTEHQNYNYRHQSEPEQSRYSDQPHQKFTVQTAKLKQSDEPQTLSNFTENALLDHTGQTQPNVNSSETHHLNQTEISEQWNSSSEPELPHESTFSENKSELQEYSISGLFRHFNSPGQVTESVSIDKPQLLDNATEHQLQNHSDNLNDNISSSTEEKPAADIKLSPIGNQTHHLLDPELSLSDNQSRLRQHRQLEASSLNHSSNFSHSNHSLQQNLSNPHYLLQYRNQFQQPVHLPRHNSYSPENQHLNYPVIPHGICFLEKTHGPCHAEHSRYFYNVATRNCEKFIYGGCQGNPNNFLTIEECQSVCKVHPYHGMPLQQYWQYDRPQPPNNDVGYRNLGLPLWHPGPALAGKVCSLEKKLGPCNAVFHRYFFNAATNSCETFVYGGCYGNANNFLTKEECEFVCIGL